MGRVYPNPRDTDELLAAVGLEDKADAKPHTLSGGMRRRLDVALAVVGNPELVFLDEPTTGFDPEARRQFWTMIESLRSGGTTIVLTTHYMDEAEYLADRIAIINARQSRRARHPRRLARPRDRLDGVVAGRRRQSASNFTATPTAVLARAVRRNRRERSTTSRSRSPRSRTCTSLADSGLGGADHHRDSPAARLCPPSRFGSTRDRAVIELKEFFRSREQMIFIFSFPLILMVLFGSIFGGQDVGRRRELLPVLPRGHDRERHHEHGLPVARARHRRATATRTCSSAFTAPPCRPARSSPARSCRC